VTSTCIVMLSALGDAVHVLPLLTAIKRHSPTTHLTWVTQPPAAALVRGHPALDDLIVFDRAVGLRAYLDTRRAATRPRPFDTLLDLQTYLKAGLLTALIPANEKLGFDHARARDLNWLFTTRKIPPNATTRHVQDQYLEFLDALSIPRGQLEWNLGPYPAERPWQQQFFAQFTRPIAALVIGTSRPQKDWLPAHWAAVADALSADYGLQPVMVGGTSPRERATAQAITAAARHPVHDALGSGLRPLVSILGGAALVISLDTGPLHMAVALNRPVISLIGYNDPAVVGPYRRFTDLLIDAYGDPTVGPRLRPGRMATITPGAVLAKVDLWRSRYQ
jgi:heptosyltransferase I